MIKPNETNIKQIGENNFNDSNPLKHQLRSLNHPETNKNGLPV